MGDILRRDRYPSGPSGIDRSMKRPQLVRRQQGFDGDHGAGSQGEGDNCAQALPDQQWRVWKSVQEFLQPFHPGPDRNFRRCGRDAVPWQTHETKVRNSFAPTGQLADGALEPRDHQYVRRARITGE